MPSPVSSTQAIYNGPVLAFTVDATVDWPALSLTSADAGVDFNQIIVRDGFVAGGGTIIEDLFSASLETTGDVQFFRLALRERFTDTTIPIVLVDPDCINSVALPDFPYSPLSCFNLTTELVARNLSTDPAVRFSFTLDLTSIERVPLPGTLALLVLGLAGLGLARRKR